MNSTFLSDFIMITSFKTVAFIIVLLAVLFGVNVMAKKKVKFSTRMIVSTIVGLILGVIIQVVAGFPNNPGEVQWITEVRFKKNQKITYSIFCFSYAKFRILDYSRKAFSIV